MSFTNCGSTMSRRLVAVLMAALFSLVLALNPTSSPPAHALSADGARAAVASSAVRVAAAQVGIRYLYGGTTRRGFDCSGLTQYAYARVGRSLPRTTTLQYRATAAVTRGYQRPGDLIFFYTGRTVYHMGIYAGNGYMWHSPRTGSRVSRVKIWTSHFRVGRVL